MARSYIVKFTAAGIGKSQSSRWALRSDAESYAATVTDLGRTDVSIVESNASPEILPHCPGSIAQAIGGKCFACGKVVTKADAQAWRGDDTALRAALESVFGREWLRLTESDKALIVRDCTEDGGVQDLAQYRRNIGTGNLEAYAKTQRVRFAGK
jgi:hypothetical protein